MQIILLVRRVFNSFVVNLILHNCCVFRPAFGCAQHPKAGRNTQHTFSLLVDFLVKNFQSRNKMLGESQSWVFKALLNLGNDYPNTYLSSMFQLSWHDYHFIGPKHQFINISWPRKAKTKGSFINDVTQNIYFFSTSLGRAPMPYGTCTSVIIY